MRHDIGCPHMKKPTVGFAILVFGFRFASRINGDCFLKYRPN
jgi:hypothetical protein